MIKMILTEKERAILNKISVSIAATSDVLLYSEYENITSDFARGYIKSFSKYAEDKKVLLIYFIIKTVFTKL